MLKTYFVIKSGEYYVAPSTLASDGRESLATTNFEGVICTDFLKAKKFFTRNAAQKYLDKQRGLHGTWEVVEMG
jgi:hypothetical protein